MAKDFALESTQAIIRDILESMNPLLVPIASEATQLRIESAINLIEADTSAIADSLGGYGTRLHFFAENPTVPSGSETAILTYSVPAGKVLRITAFDAWADVDAEYKLKIDGTQKDGGRTSIAMPTLQKLIVLSAIEASAGQIVTVTAYRQSPAVNLPFKSSISGVLVNA